MTKKKEEVKVDPIEEARALLMAEEQKKQQKCMDEVYAVLTKYGYVLNIVNQITLIPKG